MKLQTLIVSSVLSLMAGSVLAGAPVDVYKSPYCGCCGKWVEHLRARGFEVRTHDVTDVPGQRKKLGMPEAYGSCHTAKVDGYTVEGHVPAADIQKLLKERPKVTGIAVPGMPMGSPGMEQGSAKDPYDTVVFTKGGARSVYVKHR